MIVDAIIIGLFVSNIFIAVKNDEMHGAIGWGTSLLLYLILIIRYGF